MQKLSTLMMTAAVLSACSSSGDIVKQIAAVQKATASACSFLPTATMVADIFTKNQDKLKTVEQVAAAICAVAASGKSTLIATPPSVAGVPIDGFFVEKGK